MTDSMALELEQMQKMIKKFVDNEVVPYSQQIEEDKLPEVVMNSKDTIS